MSENYKPTYNRIQESENKLFEALEEAARQTAAEAKLTPEQERGLESLHSVIEQTNKSLEGMKDDPSIGVSTLRLWGECVTGAIKFAAGDRSEDSCQMASTLVQNRRHNVEAHLSKLRTQGEVGGARTIESLILPQLDAAQGFIKSQIPENIPIHEKIELPAIRV